MTIKLVGLPEGLVGASTVHADSVDDVFRRYPQLEAIRAKLTVESGRIVGFAPCDG